MFGLILDQNYREPLYPISSGPIAGPRAESHYPLGYVTADDNPLGLVMPSTKTIVILAAVAGTGLFLWKHKTGQKIVRKAKSVVGLGRSRRRTSRSRGSRR